MSMTTYSRGSKPLAGAGSLSYRMPVGSGLFPFMHVTKSVKRNTFKCDIAGSIPLCSSHPNSVACNATKSN